MTELEYALQLACDLFIHSAALYFSGVHQPVRLLLPGALTIAAVTLPWRYSVVLRDRADALHLAAGALLPLQTFPLSPGKPAGLRHVAEFRPGGSSDHLFAARMAEELRRQEELRAIRREEGLRDQQLLAVAT